MNHSTNVESYTCIILNMVSGLREVCVMDRWMGFIFLWPFNTDEQGRVNHFLFQKLSKEVYLADQMEFQLPGSQQFI